MPFQLLVKRQQLDWAFNKLKGTLTGDEQCGSLTWLSNDSWKHVDWTARLSFGLDDSSTASGELDAMREFVDALMDPTQLTNVSKVEALVISERDFSVTTNLVHFAGGRLVVIDNNHAPRAEKFRFVYAVRVSSDETIDIPSLVTVEPLRLTQLYAALTGQWWPGKDS